MNCKTYGSIQNCVIKAPPSKSMAHRAILAAMLANQPCVVDNVCLSADIKATLASAKALGKEYTYCDGKVFFGAKKQVDNVVINANESGSTLRFLMPICGALGVTTTFVGQGKLPQRPYNILADAMTKNGVEFDKKEGLPLTINGKLQSGIYNIAGDVSSQYITGLLYALPLVDGDSEIVLTSPLQSKGYVDMTLCVLNDFGIEIEQTANGYKIKGNQQYKAKDFVVEGDWSNGAFWLVAGALNNGITVTGLDTNSLQGDKEILSVLKKMGAKTVEKQNEIIVEKSTLTGVEIDVSQIPDLAPILSVALACAKGKGKITNASRLKIKESDRLQAINDNLNAVGIKTLLGNDWVEIVG
ncbi:MAG: 3-phosphoshikimate 1-carboxyvinyltransferase, partial [Clostridia bacterium]|nr:3-phosphoshikimate 1-carboxyvinyltransferase [Clostridia bacterium]